MNDQNDIQVHGHIYMSQSVTSAENLKLCILLSKLQRRRYEQKL